MMTIIFMMTVFKMRVFTQVEDGYAEDGSSEDDSVKGDLFFANFRIFDLAHFAAVNLNGNYLFDM